MSLTKMAATLASAAVLALPLSALTLPAEAATHYKNCTALHKHYKHGVGKKGAHDHTSGTPVTNFKRSSKLYKANKKLDRDKDGIACEAH
jgi:uncharacterized membrane protein